MIKINNFRGDLSDISAKTATLMLSAPAPPQAMMTRSDSHREGFVRNGKLSPPGNGAVGVAIGAFSFNSVHWVEVIMRISRHRIGDARPSNECRRLETDFAVSTITDPTCIDKP